MRALLIGIFSLFLVFFSIDSVVAESEEVDVSIGFDFSFGEIIDDEKIISGTVVSSEEEIEISWEIYNSTGFKYNWGLFDSESEQLTPLSGDYFSMDWEMLIKSNDYYSCSCEFKVSVSFDSTIILEETMPFFISNENYASDSNYTMLIENPLENDWINGNLSIEARISDIAGENPSSAQIYVKRYVTFTETCNDEPLINDENDVSLSFNDDNFFSYELEMDTKPDGWYELVIIIPKSNEPDIIDFHSCLSFKLNNLSPTISIQNPPFKDLSQMYNFETNKNVLIYKNRDFYENIVLDYKIDKNKMIDYVTDTTHNKQGKYTPGTHIKIISPEYGMNDTVDYAFLGAWNFKKEIFKKEKNFLKRGGKFVTHVPKVMLL